MLLTMRLKNTDSNPPTRPGPYLGKWFTRWYEAKVLRTSGFGWRPDHRRLKSLASDTASWRPCAWSKRWRSFVSVFISLYVILSIRAGMELLSSTWLTKYWSFKARPDRRIQRKKILSFMSKTTTDVELELITKEALLQPTDLFLSLES